MEDRGLIVDHGDHCEITQLGFEKLEMYQKHSGLMVDKDVVRGKTSLRHYIKRVCDRPNDAPQP